MLIDFYFYKISRFCICWFIPIKIPLNLYCVHMPFLRPHLYVVWFKLCQPIDFINWTYARQKKFSEIDPMLFLYNILFIFRIMALVKPADQLSFPREVLCIKNLKHPNTIRTEHFSWFSSLLAPVKGENEKMTVKQLRFARFGLRALAVTASTVAILDIIKQQWIPAASCTLAWMLIAWVERDLINSSKDSPEPWESHPLVSKT